MKSSYAIAAGITVAAVLWLASGLVGSDGAGAEGGAPAVADREREPFAVRVADLTAAPMVREIIVNGRSEANRAVTLRSEIRGLVEEVLVAKGTQVEAGAPLVRIAVNARKADLAEARANLELRRIELEAATKLAERGFQSEVRRAEARARFEAAQAQLRQAELAVANTEVRAPFAGIVDERLVEVGDFVDTRDPIATIVDLDPIKFVAFVTERNVVDLSVGAAARVRLLDGSDVEGTVTFVASRATENARTFRVEVEAPNADRRIVSGITTSLRLPVADKLAHKISPAALTLDDSGTIGVKLVDAQDIVHFQPVTILGSSETGVWLGGLPERVRIVVVGQEFIVPGERVRPVPVEGGLS